MLMYLKLSGGALYVDTAAERWCVKSCFHSLTLKHLVISDSVNRTVGYFYHTQTGTQAHCLYITQQMSACKFISSKVGMHKCYLHNICPAA